MPLVLEAVCPDGVGEGGLVAVQTADGTTVEVVVPAGVSAGDSFTIEYTPTNSAPWLEEILEALVSENFVRVLDSWCEHECSKFLRPGEEGHTLEQTAVHASCARARLNPTTSWVAAQPCPHTLRGPPCPHALSGVVLPTYAT